MFIILPHTFPGKRRYVFLKTLGEEGRDNIGASWLGRMQVEVGVRKSFE